MQTENLTTNEQNVSLAVTWVLLPVTIFALLTKYRLCIVAFLLRVNRHNPPILPSIFLHDIERKIVVHVFMAFLPQKVLFCLELPRYLTLSIGTRFL